jgi:hypothetical protein
MRFLKKGIFLSMLIYFSPSANFSLRAQPILSDDFSGNTVTATNAWTGDVNHFIANAAGQLQLNAPTGGSSTLAIPYQPTDSISFSSYASLDFAPSTTNLLQIWISASTSDLTTADGYYLEIGENGTTDAIKLIKKQAGTMTTLQTGAIGALANQPAVVRFSLKRYIGGIWTLATDYNGGTAYQFEFTATDNDLDFTSQKYFGLYCFYTETRKDKYSFDDIKIDRIQLDLSPPTAVSAEIKDANTVQLNLNEAVAITNTLSLTATPGGIQTANVVLGPGLNSYTANLSQSLTAGVIYTFKLIGASDIAGNVSPELTFTDSFTAPATLAPSDIIINEIFPDPTPMIGLPDAEYLELFNHSNKTINGDDLIFKDGTSSGVRLTGVSFAPGDIVVVCQVSAVQNFPQGIKIIGIPSLPTLNNDGENLSISNTSGLIIDQITYDLNWYRDLIKDDGGWSIERINPDLPCSDQNNWIASTHPSGGTPGLQNAVFQLTPDTQAPSIVSAIPQANQTDVLVSFSESMDLTSLNVNSTWLVAPSITIANVQTIPNVLNQVILSFVTPLQNGVVYTVSTSSATDCAGNQISSGNQVSFGLTEAPSPNDLIINEFLFNPNTGGSRFVELFNQSNKIISLSGLNIYGGDIGNETSYQTTTDLLIFPDSFAVFTPNTSDISTRYAPNNPNHIYQNSLPTLPDDEGMLALRYFDGTHLITLDSLRYTKAWHSPFLNTTDQEGVSLEKIQPDLPSVSGSSWISATGPIHGTPTGRNSQFYVPNGTTAGLIQLDQQRLSPDGDGYEDFLLIPYQLPKPGYYGTIQIYDSEGRTVRNRVKAELFGTQGSLRWDGENDQGEIERPGIYLLYIELIEPSGTVLRSRHTITLLQKF